MSRGYGAFVILELKHDPVHEGNRLEPDAGQQSLMVVARPSRPSAGPGGDPRIERSAPPSFDGCASIFLATQALPLASQERTFAPGEQIAGFGRNQTLISERD